MQGGEGLPGEQVRPRKPTPSKGDVQAHIDAGIGMSAVEAPQYGLRGKSPTRSSLGGAPKTRRGGGLTPILGESGVDCDHDLQSVPVDRHLLPPPLSVAPLAPCHQTAA